MLKPTEAFQEALYQEMLAPHQGGRPVGALPARRALLLLAHREGQAVPDLVPQDGQPARRPRRSIARPERPRRGAPVLLPRRLHGERRRPSARLLHRRHGLPRVHALRQGPAHGRAAARPDREGVRGGVGRGPRTLFYVTEDEAKRPYRFCRHRLGGSRATRLLYEEPDALFRIGVERSRSRAFLFAGSRSFTSAEMRYLPAADPPGAWQMLAAREKDHEYEVDHGGDRLLHPHQRRRPPELPPGPAPVSDPAAGALGGADPASRRRDARGRRRLRRPLRRPRARGRPRSACASPACATAASHHVRVPGADLRRERGGERGVRRRRRIASATSR